MNLKKNILKNKLKTIFNLPFFLFLLTLLSSFSIGNIYYISTQAPDFVRYRKYVDYFILESSNLKLEQGFIYFIIVTFFIIKRIEDFPTFTNLEVNNLGNKTNFSFYNLSEFEINYSLGIQEGNFFIYIIGLVGLYKLLKLHEFKQGQIFLALSVLNFLPPLLTLRLTMKPEILGFGILPWILFLLESFKKNNNYYFLFSSVFLVAVIVTTKASIGIMILIFLLLNYFELLKNIDFKILLLIIILFLIISSVLMIESFNKTGMNLLTRASINQEFGQFEYDNKASASFLYNFNFLNLIKNPSNDFSNSFLSITLLDTFDDYFNLYWNLDYSLFKIDRKEFLLINQDKNIAFDKNTNTISVPAKFNLLTEINQVRKQLAVSVSIIFYFLSIYAVFIRKKHFRIIFGPFIGIFILLLSSFGIPENNFNPDLGDTVKVFYYGFLFAIAFVFIFIDLLKHNKIYNFFFVVLTILFFVFILGYPKQNNTYLDYSLKKMNEQTAFCELSSLSLKYTLIENTDIKCKRSSNINICNKIEEYSNSENIQYTVFINEIDEQSFLNVSQCLNLLEKNYKINGFKFNMNNLPIVSTFILLILLLIILYFSIFDNKLLASLFKKYNKNIENLY